MSTLATNLRAQRSVDPTNTKTLRFEYAEAIRARIKQWDAIQREALTGRDVLGLGPTAPLRLFQRLPRTREFAPFPSRQRLERYMEWFREAGTEIFEFEIGPRGGIRGGAPWTRDILTRSYARAIAQANAMLGPTGRTGPSTSTAFVIREPRHVEAIEAIFARNLQELHGIGRAYEQRIARIIADAIANNWTNDEAARAIAEATRMANNRANVLARTEIIRAHAEGTLNRFEQMGIQRLGIIVEFEFTTAGDLRVCPICRALEGDTYTIAQARGVIPVHPMCRCRWIPIF